MIRLRAAAWFSPATIRLAMMFSKRFCTAPKVARWLLTASMASSMAVMALCAVATSVTWIVGTCVPVMTPVPSKAPMSVLVVQSKASTTSVSMSLVALAPIWNCEVAVVARMFWPLNWVPPSVRVASCASWTNSSFRLMRSSSVLVPLADWIASSRMRWKMSLILPRAPSPTCAIEMPSLALRMATFMPRVWVFMRSAMARPAASSLALLTRRPEDSRCIDVASDDWLVLRLRWAFSETRFVLMVWGTASSLIGRFRQSVSLQLRFEPTKDRNADSQLRCRAAGPLGGKAAPSPAKSKPQ